MTKKILYFLATGFYSGLSPKAPGTTGSIVAIILAFILANICPFFPTKAGGLSMCLSVIIFALIIIHLALKHGSFSSNTKDPQEIVLDEWAGIFTTIAFIPPTLTNLILAFIFFRFFDITKFPPIKSLERLPGSWGIVVDDIAAGIYANATLQIVIALMP
jgi:phosphatidylglycerophosphatase A